MSERKRSYEWGDARQVAKAAMENNGLDFVRMFTTGEVPIPPIASTLDYTMKRADKGEVVFSCIPQEFHYNPIGTVHGGLAATLLDSAMACAVHTTLPQGMAYTTLELKINYLRAMTVKTGEIDCVGRVIHSGRQQAVAEGWIVDAAGKRIAHGTTTCLIYKIPAA